jgi:hypothetical protein
MGGAVSLKCADIGDESWSPVTQRRGRKGKQVSRSSRSRGRQQQRKAQPAPIPTWKRALVWTGTIMTALAVAAASTLGTGLVQGLNRWLIGQAAMPAVSATPATLRSSLTPSALSTPSGSVPAPPGSSPTPSISAVTRPSATLAVPSPSATPRARLSMPALGYLSVGESRQAYRLMVPIINHEVMYQQVQTIRISMDWPVRVWMGGNTYAYAVDDNLTLLRGSAIEGAVTPQTGAAAGYAYRAIGRYTSSSGGSRLTLAFRPPALILGPKAPSFIVVLLPRKMNAKSPDGSHRMISIPDFVTQDGDVAELAIKFRSGTRISTCKVSQADSC